MIHRQCCEDLKAILTNNNSKISLHDMANKIQHIVAGLERLEMLGAKEIVTSMAELSMNSELSHHWHNHTSKLTATPPVEDLISFIRRRADQAESEESRNHPKQERIKSKPQHKQRGSSHAASAPQPTPAVVSAPATTNSTVPQQAKGTQQPARSFPPCKYPCPLCEGENHYPYHCRVFETYSAAQKNEHVRIHSLCKNCLKPGHVAESCRSTYRCKSCRGLHNSLLHQEHSAASHPTVFTANAATTTEPQLKPNLMMTSQTLITGPTGITMMARALLDSGLSLSIISTKAMRTLQLKQLGTSVFIDGVGATSASKSSPLCTITLSSKYKQDWRQEITAAVMQQVTRDLPLQGASSVRQLPHLKELHLANQLFDQPATIDLLLGQDVWQDLFLPGEIIGPKGTPAAWHTVFGWVIMGQYTPDVQLRSIKSVSQPATSTEANLSSDDILAKFWEMEEPSTMGQAFTPEEQRVEEHYQATHKYLPDQQSYMVSLPKVVEKLELGDSRQLAVNRARRMKGLLSGRDPGQHSKK